MKKAIILGILGCAAGAMSTFGQGAVFLDNYFTSTYNPVVFSAGLGGGNVGNNFTVQLWYVPTANQNSTGSVGADASGTALPSDLFGGFVAATGAGSTASINPNGYFTATASFLIQPGATTPTQSSYTMMIVAFNGADYASSTIRGHSAAIYAADSAPNITGGSPIGSFFTAGTPMLSVYNVTPVPEPSTLALAGLGGFGMLMALRRKKA